MRYVLDNRTGRRGDPCDDARSTETRAGRLGGSRSPHRRRPPIGSCQPASSPTLVGWQGPRRLWRRNARVKKGRKRWHTQLRFSKRWTAGSTPCWTPTEPPITSAELVPVGDWKSGSEENHHRVEGGYFADTTQGLVGGESGQRNTPAGELVTAGTRGKEGTVLKSEPRTPPTGSQRRDGNTSTGERNEPCNYDDSTLLATTTDGPRQHTERGPRRWTRRGMIRHYSLRQATGGQ